jgi:hypothetical protein
MSKSVRGIVTLGVLAVVGFAPLVIWAVEPGKPAPLQDLGFSMPPPCPARGCLRRGSRAHALHR